MRLFQNKSMRQSHCFYYYMDGMFLSECISKSFLVTILFSATTILSAVFQPIK